MKSISSVFLASTLLITMLSGCADMQTQKTETPPQSSEPNVHLTMLRADLTIVSAEEVSKPRKIDDSTYRSMLKVSVQNAGNYALYQPIQIFALQENDTNELVPAKFSLDETANVVWLNGESLLGARTKTFIGQVTYQRHSDQPTAPLYLEITSCERINEPRESNCGEMEWDYDNNRVLVERAG